MDSMTALARANRLMPDEARLAQSSSLPQLIQAAGIGEPGLKQTERIAERQALKQIGGYEGGAWGHQALVEAGRIDPPTATTGASDLTPEMRVAEQVNYWINRDVQNAELKLDGMGEGIVKVNISLHGNEARVEFRTDEVATRQVLEGAVSHLKDLLGNEGLVLSGFSVGTSGSGAAASQDGKSRQGTRQTFIEVPEVMATEAGSGPVRLTGRTVDLYV
jgi:flagellar hook-length control protein FliK